MKPFLIRYWHGRSELSFVQSFYQRLDDLTFSNGTTTDRFFNGTLQEWTDKWKDKFIFFPPTDEDAKYIAGNIWVTPWGSFGQR